MESSSLHSIENILEQWKQEKDFLSNQFKNRTKAGVNESMAKSIDLFFEFLFTVNDKNVPNAFPTFDEFSTVSVKPINLSERIDFIMAKQDQYHSFIQLCQLYDEFTKQYHKNLIIKRQKK